MDFEFNETQEMLKNGARRFFAQEAPALEIRDIIETRGGFSPELWKKIAELGWLGIPIPEKYGGMGGNFLDMTVLLTEMGRAFFPSPFISAVVLGGLTILDYGSDEQRDVYLPSVVRGDLVPTMAVVEDDGRYQPYSIGTSLSGDTISGNKLFVPYGQMADRVICLARDGARFCLALVDASATGVNRSPIPALTHEFYARIAFDQVKLESTGVLSHFKDWDDMRSILGKASVARCAQLIGLGEHILDITVEYAKQRIQFEKPIGSFQAVQHHCADMLTALDGCRLLTHEAAWRISEGLPFNTEASMAKAWCGNAFKHIVALSHQVHGGVSLIEDHEMPLYYRFAWSSASLFGSSDDHYEYVAEDLEKKDILFEPFPLVN
ncbi:MAG: acyl-CoA/acyl-ACP dehydrogenase [Dehalococcoidia bacterium]|nr:acyl-CoA/acyl-ACP dehydrogenase [Dehalococcoidia bacterium]